MPRLSFDVYKVVKFRKLVRRERRYNVNSEDNEDGDDCSFLKTIVTIVMMSHLDNDFSHAVDNQIMAVMIKVGVWVWYQY